jgi:hypothetical protein
MPEEAFRLSLLLEKALMRPSKQRIIRRCKSQLLRSRALPEALARSLQVKDYLAMTSLRAREMMHNRQNGQT